MVKLFLDDVRTPPDNTWIVLRNYSEAVQFIANKGVPDIISFDHDLGEEESGYDFAKWLVQKHLDGDIDILNIEIRIHSANPVGRENIQGLFKSFHKFMGKKDVQ
jgi:hypothetical protein